MDSDKLKEMKNVVEDYYLSGLKQSEIAKKIIYRNQKYHA